MPTTPAADCFPAILFLIRYVASFTESIASPSIENQSPAKEKKTVFNGILKNVEVTASRRKEAMSVVCEEPFHRGRAFFSFPCYLTMHHGDARGESELSSCRQTLGPVLFGILFKKNMLFNCFPHL